MFSASNESRQKFRRDLVAGTASMEMLPADCFLLPLEDRKVEHDDVIEHFVVVPLVYHERVPERRRGVTVPRRRIGAILLRPKAPCRIETEHVLFAAAVLEAAEDHDLVPANR
jgi:hypothetical protein